MKKVDSFPAADGHIESILIGAWQVKVSFKHGIGGSLYLYIMT